MWKAQPIFVSSTFLDMQTERDHLRTHVFPELEERLRKRRYHLEWVDLRVGVATASLQEEDTRERHMLKVCLAEVARCRPFLIGLVGDHYGSVPAPERIKAAIGEADFVTDAVGRSITDLEIEFGAFVDREQQPRSLFYFREPLPYREMPTKIAALYSDAYDTGPAAAERASRLAMLKRRIATLLPSRIRRYVAGWDNKHHKVIGLDAWGRMVLDDIWSELDTATKTASLEVEPSWHAIERNALDDFIEDRSRNFIGRQELLARLTDFAVSPTHAGSLLGVCITGDAGSGKSALFGELRRRLSTTDTFVLAHAAGASVASPSVDSMLRRWIVELAAALGTDPGLAENADPEAVETTFNALLGRMTMQRRVIVLVDALDQFETTTRGRLVTWLARSWPANARLIATAIEGAASQALSKRPDVDTQELPPLDAAEARGIIKSICDKYHRTFELEVVETLLATAGARRPPSGNPLWLALAVEELNLLDADDFARARRAYAGAPAEQLRALMIDIAASFPAEISGLYLHSFERAEELFGTGVSDAFLGLIAVSRTGWRELDFRILLPRISGEAWDELKFAQLRRVFRGQMRLHGALEQWGFSHEQMREAARLHLATRGLRETDLHAAIADHLLALPSDDPLRQSETMVHLLDSENWATAAHYYGDDPGPDGHRGATEILVNTALALAGDGKASGLERVMHLLDPIDTDISYQEYAAERLIYNVLDLLRARAASLEVQGGLARRIADYFDDLITSDPHIRSRYAVHRAASRSRLGNVQQARGRLADAEASYRRSAAIWEQLTLDHPDVVEWRRDGSVACNNIGKLQLAQGRVDEALASFQQGLALVQDVADVQPDEPDWQRDLSISHVYVGDAQLAQGEAAGAEESYRAALAIEERLVAGNPGHLDHQFDLSVAISRLGNLQASRGDLTSAEDAARSNIAVLERLVGREPDNLLWRYSLSGAHQHLSFVQMRRDRAAEAEASLHTATAILERLTERDPANTAWQLDLATNYLRLCDMLIRTNIDDAEKSCRASLAITERLTHLEPGDSKWQSHLASNHLMLGRVQEMRDNLTAADTSYRASLAIAQRMSTHGPQKQSWAHDLAMAHNSVARIQREWGEFAEAEASLGEAIVILQEAVRRDPANVDEQNNLAACHADLADMQRKRGDLAGTEKSCRATLAIVERLADRAPDWVHLNQLAGCYHRLRIVQSERGDLAGAQATLESARAVEMRRDHLTRYDQNGAAAARTASQESATSVANGAMKPV